MTDTIAHPAWMARALCAQPSADPDLWFPESDHRDKAAAAKAVCARCPVRLECGDYARVTGATDGVWGGLSPEERGVFRRNRGQTLTPAAKDRKAGGERERRRRLRQAAAAGDPGAIAWIERDRARKRVNRQEVAA